MKAQEDYSKTSFSEFQRYIRGEMTKNEENTFQRRLNDGTLAEEIVGGIFSGFSYRKQSRGIDHYGEKQKRKFRPMLLISVSASAAVLIITASVFIFLYDKKPVRLSGFKVTAPVLPEARGVGHITEIPPQESFLVPYRLLISGRPEITKGFTDTFATSLVENQVKSNDSGIISDMAVTDSVLLIKEGQKDTPYNVSGMQVNSDMQAADTGEVVFSSDNQAKLRTGYISAGPVTGSSNYYKYIQDNIKKPVAQPVEKEVLAIASFIVRSTGTIDSIQVTNNPGEEYAKEAIRLIREGPAWKPAEENGRTIDDKVRLSIVFR